MNLLEPVLILALHGCAVSAGVLSVAEVSIVRVRRSQVLVDARKGVARSEQLLQLIDDLPVVLNTVLLLVLLCQVGAATIAAFLAERWFGGLGVTVATFVLTATLFVYAEAIPKTRAVRVPETTALRLTPMLRHLVRFLRPIVIALVRLADLHSPGSVGALGPSSEAEIRALAIESAEAGAIGRGDADLVERSFEFNDRAVRDVMVPRSRIEAVSGDRTVTEVRDRAIALGHRRLPVYRDGLDDVVGVVRLRDLVALAATDPGTTAESAMTSVLTCPPHQLISELLQRMQVTGQWLAVVIDGGSTVGLATIEDIVAELVGEIADERAAPGNPGSLPPQQPGRRHPG